MELGQFLELFHPLPGNRYIQVTQEPDATTQALSEILQEAGGELRLALYTKEQKRPSLEGVKPQYIENFSAPFRALPREHDCVIFKDIFAHHTNQKMLLRIAYTTLANTADIIIMEKKGVLNVAATKEMLELFEFRAPNAIDVLAGYDLVMAKKMHMWGNGL